MLIIFLNDTISCDVFNASNSHEILRYLFQILATPLIYILRSLDRYIGCLPNKEEVIKGLHSAALQQKKNAKSVACGFQKDNSVVAASSR